MIGFNALSQAAFDIRLPPDAAVRLAPPSDADGETWWQIGEETWLRALPRKSVMLDNPDETRVAQASFRSDYPRLAVDEDADWINAPDALNALADDLVAGLKRRLAASVPVLPTRAPVHPPSELHLDWPARGPGDPVVRRQRRLAELAALTGYAGRMAETDRKSDPSVEDLRARLLRHVSAVPRPAEARLRLAPEGHGGLALTWDQAGNPDLLWGAAAISWHDPSRAVRYTPLSPGDAGEKRRLGASAQLLAMATAVEAATGGCAVPLRLGFRTAFDRTLTATLRISPEQWGFDLATMVHRLKHAHVPTELRLRMER
jgi:hypothetical protein